MNRSNFFEAARSGVFAGKLKQEQVDGLDAILDEAEKRGTPITHLAYILATTHHETGTRMQPVRELGGNKYLSKYDTGKLAKALGNTPQADGDGQKFAGRGFVQITGRANYRKFGIETAPDKALEMPTALMILFNGMTKGMFTGKKMSDFLDGATPDYYGARAIVNGDKQKNGAKIAVTAKAFEKALRGAGYDGKPSAKPVTIERKPIADGNWLARLLAAILSIFRGGK
jgi:putative chitinase